jgi:hypothetical protein
MVDGNAGIFRRTNCPFKKHSARRDTASLPNAFKHSKEKWYVKIKPRFIVCRPSGKHSPSHNLSVLLSPKLKILNNIFTVDEKMEAVKLRDQNLLRTEAFINGEWRPVRTGEGVFAVTSKCNHHLEVIIVTVFIARQIQQHPRPYQPCPTLVRTLATTPSMEPCVQELS